MQTSIMQFTERDPIELLGIAFVAIGIILFLSFGFRLLFSYKRTEKKQTLYLALEFIFGGLGMFFLLVEQVILMLSVEVIATAPDVITDPPIPPMQSFFQYSGFDVFSAGWVGAALAWISSGIAIIAAVFFVVSFFPTMGRKYLIPPIILILVYLALIIISPFQWNFSGSDWSPEHDPTINIILWILFFIPLWSVAFLFLYLTFSLFRRGSPSWRRLCWIFVSQTLLSIAFTIEIVNPSMITEYLIPALIGSEGVIATISRFFLMIYPMLMWIGVLTPSWAKGMLGVTT
ncbi:MAG: hypothetical protein ACFFB5_04190 [Promethearchaeota archaeon]